MTVLLSTVNNSRLRRSVGKVGKESAAAKYGAATPSDDFSIEEEKPYAEVCHTVQTT